MSAVLGQLGLGMVKRLTERFGEDHWPWAPIRPAVSQGYRVLPGAAQL